LPFFRPLLRFTVVGRLTVFSVFFSQFFPFFGLLPSFAVLTVSQVVSASFGICRWRVLLCFFTILAVGWFFSVFCCIFGRFTGFFTVGTVVAFLRLFFVMSTIFLPVLAFPFYLYDFGRFTGFFRISDGFCQFSARFRVIDTIWAVLRGFFVFLTVLAEFRFLSCLTRFSPVYGVSDAFHDVRCGLIFLHRFSFARLFYAVADVDWAIAGFVLANRPLMSSTIVNTRYRKRKHNSSKDMNRAVNPS
jgi:hypothetical protein